MIDNCETTLLPGLLQIETNNTLMKCTCTLTNIAIPSLMGNNAFIANQLVWLVVLTTYCDIE